MKHFLGWLMLISFFSIVLIVMAINSNWKLAAMWFVASIAGTAWLCIGAILAFGNNNEDNA